jgi:hypothetical protein
MQSYLSLLLIFAAIAGGVYLISAVAELVRTDLAGPLGTSIPTFEHELQERIAKDPGLRTTVVLTSFATRITVSLLILFLVQILVSLYRYTSRLALYFDARADALAIAGSELNYLETVKILSPDAIDFGKHPKVPTEHVTDIAKAIIAAAKELK